MSVLIAAICVTGPVRAQDFQIGGDEQSETSVPLEIRPSLGLFVQGYVNGRGPYQFSISLTGHTLLSPAVIMDAGLATRDKGVARYGNTNGFEQNLQLTDATLRLGDREISLNGGYVFPDDDIAAYSPARNYGGILGVEVFRQGMVSVDLSHARLVLSPHTDIVPAPNAIELSLAQSATGAELDRLPALTLSLGGQSGRFRMAFFTDSVSFQQDSRLGQDLLDKSPHRIIFREWTPNGIVRFQSGTATPFGIGDRQAKGSVSISRSLDPLPVPAKIWPRQLLSVREPPVDGVVGLRVLGAFDINIENSAGKIWLTPRGKNSSLCRSVSQGNLRGSTGLTPWIYKGQGMVRTVAEGSPAEAAGIEPGDQIVSIDDADVPAYYDHLDSTCFAPALVKVVFRNASGDHSVVLTPAEP